MYARDLKTELTLVGVDFYETPHVYRQRFMIRHPYIDLRHTILPFALNIGELDVINMT